MRKQRVILEHQAHTAGLGRLMTAFSFNQASADEDQSGIRPLQPCRDPERGRLTAARRTKKTNNLTARNIQADSVHRRAAAKAPRDRAQRQAVTGTSRR